MSCKVKVISGRTVCLQSNWCSLTLNSIRDSADCGHCWAPESALFQAFATHASGAWWRGVFHVCGTCVVVVVVQGAVVVVARRARHTSCLR